MFETEVKPKIIYREINCKSAINKIKNKFGFCNDLNIYRGCLHKCYYCYAVYSHKYINSRDFFNEIFVKKNIAEVLEKELSSKSWKRETINLGSVADSYQKAEEDYHQCGRARIGAPDAGTAGTAGLYSRCRGTGCRRQISRRRLPAGSGWKHLSGQHDAGEQ